METVTAAENEFHDDIVTPAEPLDYPVHEIIYALVCILAVCTDYIIIHILFRFRRMQTVPNMFLVNWIIADACCLLLSALYCIIWVIMYLVTSIDFSSNYYCAHIEMEVALYFACIYFVALISIDWFIAAFFQRFIENFRKYYKFLIGFVWIFSLIFWGVSTGLCYKAVVYELDMGYSLFITCALLLFIITTQVYVILQKIKKRPVEYSTLMLTLTSIFVLSRVPEFIHYIVYLTVGDSSYLFSTALMYITPLHSIVNLFLLYWLNEDFQACLRQFLKRADQTYMEATTAFENTDENEDHQFPVRIALNDSNEELVPNA